MNKKLSARQTILIVCEGRGDKRFIETYLAADLKARRICSITIAPVGGNALIQSAQEKAGNYTHIFVFADGDRWKDEIKINPADSLSEKKDKRAVKKCKNKIIEQQKVVVFEPCIEAFILEFDRCFSINHFAGIPCDSGTAPAKKAKKEFERAYKSALIDISLRKKLNADHFSQDNLRQCQTLEPWWKFCDMIINACL